MTKLPDVQISGLALSDWFFNYAIDEGDREGTPLDEMADNFVKNNGLVGQVTSDQLIKDYKSRV